MRQYQSFPGEVGDSNSVDKLRSIFLPDLNGKKVLDIGCNEGFFCGYAKFSGATRVVGIDFDPEFIVRAKKKFPDCEFICTDWSSLPNEKFDVILLLSAIHYADDQIALIDKLVSHLNPGGVLILEMGVLEEGSKDWIPIKRSIDTRYFPTRNFLFDAFDKSEDYGWKQWGESVAQAGDPVRRYVFHLVKKIPVAYLLLQPGGFGKTTISRWLFNRAKIKNIRGDTVIIEINKGIRKKCNQSLNSIINSEKYKNNFHIGLIIDEICKKNLLEELIDCWLDGIEDMVGDISIDSYIPQSYHDVVVKIIRNKGFLPVSLVWDPVSNTPLKSGDYHENVDSYIEHLLGNLPANQTEEGLVEVHPKGHIDRVNIIGDSVVVSGWAIEKNGRLPSKFTVRCNDSSVVVNKFQAVNRPDVVRHLKLSNNVRLGFSFEIKSNAIINNIKNGAPIEVVIGSGFCFSKKNIFFN